MRNEYEANLSLQPMDRKPCRPEAIEHYSKPSDGAWTLFRWAFGVVVAGAAIGFLAGFLSAVL